MAITNTPMPFRYTDVYCDPCEPGIDQVYRAKRIASSLEESMRTIKTFGEDNHVSNISHRIARDLTNSEDYKEQVRRDLANQLANIALKKTAFTQIMVPPDQAYDEVEVRARCVIMSVEELASLIRRLRHS